LVKVIGALTLDLFTAPLVAGAQPVEKTPRIGLLLTGADPSVEVWQSSKASRCPTRG